MTEETLDLYLPESDLAPIIQKQLRDLNHKQKLLTLCERFPQAFALGEMRAAGTGWQIFPFDGDLNFHIKISHPEALAFLRETIQAEKEQTMAQELSKQEDNTIKNMLAANIKAVKTVLPKHMTPERMMRIAYTAISRSPMLARCTPMSLLNAVIEASMLGLEVNSPLGQASMVTFYNGKTKQMEAQLIPEYKGKIELAYRSGLVKSFQAHPVYKEDNFHYSYGLTPDLVHVPSKKADRGGLIAAYAVVNYLNGGVDFEVIEEAEAMQAKSKSASAKQDEKNKTTLSVWNSDDEASMWVKTAVHRLFKRVPKSPEYQALARAQELAAKADAGEPQELDFLDVDFTVQDPPAPITNGKKDLEQEKQKDESTASVKREDPENPVWAQLEATKEAVGEIYEKALKRLKLTDPVTTVDDAKEMMKACNSLADGGK